MALKISSPSTFLLSLLLFSSSLLSSVHAQGFNNIQQTSSSTTSTSISSTRTSTSSTATSTGVHGQCADNCKAQHPTLNHCNDTETGTALDQCKCQSYKPSDDPLVNCVLGCPSDEQYNFAEALPKLCAQTLFLGLDLTDQTKPSAVNSAPSATLGAAQSTATASGNAGVKIGAGANVLSLLSLTLGIAVFL